MKLTGATRALARATLEALRPIAQGIGLATGKNVVTDTDVVTLAAVGVGLAALYVSLGDDAPGPLPLPAPGPSPQPVPQPPAPGGEPVPPGVPSNGADMIDFRAVEIERSPDARNWPITVTITNVVNDPSTGFALTFDRPVPFPDYVPPGWEGPIQYTVWFFAFVNGGWRGAGFVQMWRDRSMTDGAIPSLPEGYGLLWGPQGSASAGVFGDYVPQRGDTIGIAITAGNARAGASSDGVTSVAERSNIVTLVL